MSDASLTALGAAGTVGGAVILALVKRWLDRPTEVETMATALRNELYEERKELKAEIAGLEQRLETMEVEHAKEMQTLAEQHAKKMAEISQQYEQRLLAMQTLNDDLRKRLSLVERQVGNDDSAA